MIRPGIWRRELAVPLQSIQAELNRLFEEYWQFPNAPAGPTGSDPSLGQGPRRSAAPTATDAEGNGPAFWTPAIDLWEAPGELILAVDLPGVDPSAIDLALTGNILAIRGTRGTSSAEDHAKSTRGRVRERPAGAFYRQVTLMDDVDFERIEAQARDGVLTVRLPKRDSAQARTIPIQPARD